MPQRRLVDHQPQIAALLGPAAVTARPVDDLHEAAAGLDEIDAGRGRAWLDRLARRAAPALAPQGAQALAQLLAPLARQVLARDTTVPRGDPIDATAFGNAEAAGRAFGLELEGLSAEDQTFALARHFVRYARAAARQSTPRRDTPTPHAAAQRGALLAARALAPGLLPWLRRATASTPTGHDPAPESSPPPKEPAMHDIDRTQMEFSSEMPGFEAEQYEYAEGEWGQESGAVLSETDEFELASELLGVSSEEELDQFLGSLIKKVARGAGKLIRSPIGQAVGGVLKGVAKKALPLAGGALGGMVGGPLGAKIGSGLASAAGDAIGLEGEALSQEDQEFEGAKQFVKLAADTVKKAASAPPSSDPRAIAQAAAVSAARMLAPGLLRGGGNSGGNAPRGAAGGPAGQSGRWVRRGNSIVIYGA